MSTLQQDIPPVFVLAGLTGSGKTAFIQHLQHNREQALDIENMCRHDGSAFAGLRYATQPSSYQFHKQLIKQWNQFDTGKPVFIESELQQMGRIRLPDWLYKIISNAPVIWLNTAKRTRVQSIASTIRAANPVQFCICLQKLSGRLGEANVALAVQYFEKGNMEALVEVLLAYYDTVPGYYYPVERVIASIATDDRSLPECKAIGEYYLRRYPGA